MRERRSRVQEPPIQGAHPRRGLLRVAAAVALALLAAGCGSQQSPASLAFGPFAGYSWHGRVGQVSAAMVVPRIRTCPAHGFAGTWIGAEGEVDPQTQAAPFFQVGVNEECAPRRDTYYAFWSSTAQHFHPRWLFYVKPGDTIQLSMRRDGDRWLMQARDLRSGARRSVAASLGQDVPLALASWHQEDVTDERTSSPFPYPTLSVVRFSALQVNYRPPAAAELTTIWMSTDRAIFGPTRPAADAFTIGEIHPPEEDLRYQQIVSREDFPAYLLNAKLASWTPATRSSTIRAAALSFARVLRTNIASLRAYHWSAGVRPAIGHLITVTVRFRQIVQRLAARTGSYLDQFRLALRRAGISEAGLAVKAKLHMGVTDPSLITIQSYLRAHSG